MIGYALAFLAGAAFASLLPDSFRDWVRGGVRYPDIKPDINQTITPKTATIATNQPDISGGVMGHKVTTNSDNGPHTDHYRVVAEPVIENVRSGAPNKAIHAFMNLGRGLGRILGFCLTHPVLLFGLILVVAWLALGTGLVRVPFGFGQSKDDLRAALKQERLRSGVLERLRERDEEISAILQNTARQLEQIRLESQRGHDEIAAATPDHEEPLDTGLVAAWRASLDRLCVPRADGNRSDTCGP